jgi:hypothetical protein
VTLRILSGVGIAIALLFGQTGVLAGGAGGQNRGNDRGQYDSSDARQHGYEHGYRDGADRGRQDRERNIGRRLDPNDYRAAARGQYDPSYGDRREFMSGYQQGFQDGYDDGYNFYDRSGRYDQIYRGRGRDYGQNDGRNRDGRANDSRGYSNAPRSGPPSDNAFDSGYREGVAAGQQDQRQNTRSDYRRSRSYQSGDANFQDGFDRGYQDGYGRSRFQSDGGGYFPSRGNTGPADTRDGQGPQNRTITVPANQQWTPTGIRVNFGDKLQLQISGQITLSTNNPKDVAIPQGSLLQRRAPNSPMPNVLAGALIGRIDGGQPFGIGNLSSILAPASGMLYLGINDDVVTDNSGQFTVVVSW